jgi:hypothetical protein
MPRYIHYALSIAIASMCAAGAVAVVQLAPWSGRPAPTSISGRVCLHREAPAEIRTVGKMIAHADWPDWLGDSFRRDAPERPARRARSHRRDEPAERQSQRLTTFRTVCVRLCDGYYWPVSFATGRDRLANDAMQCAKSCPSRARLFMHRNPGETIEDLVDLDGRPYRKLATAFLYRTQYIADCTCRGHPWEEEARARHRAYLGVASSKTIAKAR